MSYRKRVRRRLAGEAVAMVDPIEHDSIEGYFGAVEARKDAVECAVRAPIGPGGTEGAGVLR